MRRRSRHGARIAHSHLCTTIPVLQAATARWAFSLGRFNHRVRPPTAVECSAAFGTWRRRRADRRDDEDSRKADSQAGGSVWARPTGWRADDHRRAVRRQGLKSCSSNADHVAAMLERRFPASATMAMATLPILITIVYIADCIPIRSPATRKVYLKDRQPPG